jgi:phosphate transport system substrate-binding protein
MTAKVGIWARGAVILALAASVQTSGCAGSHSAADASIIRIDGSSTVFPVTEAVAEEFQKANPNVRITVGISGTGGGFQKFCRDETDISNASRPISKAEMEACERSGVKFVELPVAYDGLAIVVNPRNTWAPSMTVAELKKLWEPTAQGRIMRWSQVRDGWPDKEIHLFGPGVDSGTFDYFTEAVMGAVDQSRGDYTSSEDDNVIVQGIGGDEYALGYFGFAYYEENADKLKLVAIDDGNDANGKGPILPSPETVKDGTYHPLSRPVFIYPKLASLDRPVVKALVEYYVSEGPPLVREVGYIPLSEAEYALVKTRLDNRTVGSMYDVSPGQTGMTLEQRLTQ